MLFFACHHVVSINAQCNLDLGNDTVYCGIPFVLDAGSGYQNYLWNGGQTTQTITVDAVGIYAVTVTSIGENLVFNGDFELGNTGFFTNYLYNATSLWNEGTYWVGPNAAIVHSNFVGTNHTPPPGVNFMVINGSGIPGTVVWSQTINTVPGINYIFSAWISSVVAANPAQLQFYINGIALGPIFSAPNALNVWVEYFQIWNSAGNTIATISLVNQTTILSGNDFGVDDIYFAPVVPCVDSIYVNPPNLSASITPSPVACKGESTGEAVTSVTGGYPNYSYEWSNNSVSGTLENVPAGNYTVTVTDLAGCTVEVSTTINEPLNALEFGHTAVDIDCHGNQNGSIDLWVNGGAFPYTYNWGFSTQQDVNNLSGGNYTVTIEDDGGCVRTYSASVFEPADLTITLNHQDLSCAGDTNGFITSVITGGITPYNYQWSSGQGSYAITNLGAGFYQVTIIDANACLEIGSVTLTEPSPILLYTSANQTICLSNEAQIITNAIGGSPPYQYFWNPGGLGLSNLTVSPDRSTEYCVFIQDANNCRSNLRCVSITVMPPLSLELNLSHDSICRGDTIQILTMVSGGNGGPYVTEIFGSGAISPSEDYIPENSHHVVIYAYDGCGTPAVYDSKYVLVSDPPPVSFKADIVAGCPPLEVQFTNNIPIETDYKYFWEFDDASYFDNSIEHHPYHIFRNPGVYDVSLKITNSLGCSNQHKHSGMIEVYPKPIANFSSDVISVDMLDPVVNFYNHSTGGANFYWQFGDGDSVSVTQPIPHAYSQPGNYFVSLIAENIFNCLDTAWLKIEVSEYSTFYLPNAIHVFSLIQDNRIFKPIGIDIPEEGYILQVFSRWGEIVFESKHPDLGWDGKSGSGNLAKSGSYVYRIQYLNKDKKPVQVSGNVSLIY